MATDLKNMVKSSLVKNRVFFEAVMNGIGDLRYHANSLGGTVDDLLVAQIDGYIAELKALKNSIAGVK